MELILEAILYLPAKVAIFLMTFFYLLYPELLQIRNEPLFGYSVIGITAYVFPLKWLCFLIFVKFPEMLKQALDIGTKNMER